MATRANHLGILKHATITTVLAVVLTVLIAWACAWVTPNATSAAYTMSSVPGAIADWVSAVPDDWPNEPMGTTIVIPPGAAKGTIGSSVRTRLRQGMNLGVGVTRGPAGTVVSFDGDPRFVLDQIRVGWPVHTMIHRGPDDARPESHWLLGRWYERGLPIPGKPRGSRRLPLHPLWGPFVLSVFITAVALETLWQAWRIPPRVRRARRETQGRCLKCGYDLAGMSRCPECGTPRA